MNYRHLGNSGLKVSEIGLGSWLTHNETESIHRAYDLGINFFDTANEYGQGEAERVLGKALHRYPRESYVLATKAYFPMGDGPNDRGLSRKHIIEQCNASLKRLGVDYIDLYQCHRFDKETPTEETLLALEDLVRQGKILYYGVSQWSAAQITDAVHITNERNLHPIVSNQPVYNMIVRQIESEIVPVSKKHGMGQIVFSPLAQGVLTGKYKPDEDLPPQSRAGKGQINYLMKSYLDNNVLKQVAKLEDVAGELNIGLSQLALAWILRQPGISSAIVGASNKHQLEENIKASEIELTHDVIEEIEPILTEIDRVLPPWSEND
ncbi:aldo/keto reductase family protein [Barrientosiimonas marina]|uniref:Aldo/keto reductase family protein n=1 Tax=Lentibacillus kimchii TaxID=1542911 RepID=A0ABW2UZV7_9BACI